MLFLILEILWFLSKVLVYMESQDKYLNDSTSIVVKIVITYMIVKTIIQILVIVMIVAW